MNVYDPSDYIVYVVPGADSGPPAASRPESRLPSGYANQSPRTCLRVRGTVRDVRASTGVAVLGGRTAVS